MARKGLHTHRFTSMLYPPRWYYSLWRYPFEKWRNHSTHYPLSRNEIPYPPRTSMNWKLARQLLFWPLINSEIEDMIKKCPTFLTFWNHQSSQPITNHPIPNHTWTKVAADPFCTYRYYLLIIDYYSNFFVIEMLKNF